MTTRFLHSADWQLGKPFATLGDEVKRHRLQVERVQVIRRMAAVVAERALDFVVVAGDLFDSPHVTKATVSAACEAMGLMRVPVLVIPGNHDHGGPGSIWEQEFFRKEREQLAPNLSVLLKGEPVVLEKAVVFPAPLLRRHEAGNPVAWVREGLDDAGVQGELPRIVVAHGTVQGVGGVEDDEDGGAGVANWIDLGSLPEGAVDYVALGDWHGTKQVGPVAWYSGTPEVDRFPKGEGNDPGNVLVVEAGRGRLPVVEKVATGRFVWKRGAFRFSDDESLELFAARVDEWIGERRDEHLLHLVLEGSLGIDAAGRLGRMLESWEARLARLKLEDRVMIAPSAEEIAQLTQRVEDPLIAAVASALVGRCGGESEEAAVARLALRELYGRLS
jgi:DNA repair exonuclease SbcCD nuclease subunit